MMLLLAAVLAVPGPYDRCAARIDRGGFVKSQLLACAVADMDRADAALNARYRAAMARLAPSRRVALREEERAWIDHRRAACAAATQPAIPSPAINRLRCLARETDRRTARVAAWR